MLDIAYLVAMYLYIIFYNAFSFQWCSHVSAEVKTPQIICIFKNSLNNGRHGEIIYPLTASHNTGIRLFFLSRSMGIINMQKTCRSPTALSLLHNGVIYQDVFKTLNLTGIIGICDLPKSRQLLCFLLHCLL